jgi:hypothetical protein
MQQSIDKFFSDALLYLGGDDAGSAASMRKIFTNLCKDFNIGPNDLKKQESLALVILCTTQDDESDEEVYEIAHRWLRNAASSPLKNALH